MKKYLYSTTLLISLCLHTTPSYANTVYDPIVNKSLYYLNNQIIALLAQIGAAISSSNDKIAYTIEASSKADREYLAAQEKNTRLENARRAYNIPQNICSESVSSGRVNVSTTSTKLKRSIRNGRGITYSKNEIKNIVKRNQTDAARDRKLKAEAHRYFCDEREEEIYGSAFCKADNKMPGADKRMDSLTNGAGLDSAAPQLTLNQEQGEAATLFIENTYHPNMVPDLSKVDVKSEKGLELIGQVTAYEGIISTASYAAEKELAESLPNKDTEIPLKEALESQSAKKFYDQFASDNAKKTGHMSLKEFQEFDILRRAANPYYNQDLQNLEGDNLMRELIRTNALISATLLDLKKEIREGNITQGQILAIAARNEFKDSLNENYRSTLNNKMQ